MVCCLLFVVGCVLIVVWREVVDVCCLLIDISCLLLVVGFSVGCYLLCVD